MSLKILFDLRPAFAGHAGIPHEARLLFRALLHMQDMETEGLLQAGNRWLPAGAPAEHGHLAPASVARLNARLAAALRPGEASGPPQKALLALAAMAVAAGGALGYTHRLTRFDPARYEDLLWRALFEKSLERADLAAVVGARYRVLCPPWSAAHLGGVVSGRLGHAAYPRLDTRGYDVMIAETPYPGRVSAGTRLVIRYHDAIPLLMPQTLRKPVYDRLAHRNALRRNVADGAWFACVSDATRSDLLRLFPQVAGRAVTIPNTVSESYFVDSAPTTRVPEILKTRARGAGAADAPSSPFIPPDVAAGGYLLMVSTLEPRKNHLALLTAWEALRRAGYPGLQLVLVGELGWQHEPILRRLAPWLAQGQLHWLSGVPAAELRLLYRHAAVTVCPSLGEGFGYSGVEALRSGGRLVASDLPVHREAYGSAAVYFDLASQTALTAALAHRLGARTPPGAAVVAGAVPIDATSRYLAAAVLPQWETFLRSLGPG